MGSRSIAVYRLDEASASGLDPEAVYPISFVVLTMKNTINTPTPRAKWKRNQTRGGISRISPNNLVQSGNCIYSSR